jgi:hypothetical protein
VIVDDQSALASPAHSLHDPPCHSMTNCSPGLSPEVVESLPQDGILVERAKYSAQSRAGPMTTPPVSLKTGNTPPFSINMSEPRGEVQLGRMNNRKLSMSKLEDTYPRENKRQGMSSLATGQHESPLSNLLLRIHPEVSSRCITRHRSC